MDDLLRLVAVTAAWAALVRSQQLIDSPALRKSWAGTIQFAGGSWMAANLLYFADALRAEVQAYRQMEDITHALDVSRN